MKVVCAYYGNDRRLGLVLGKLGAEHNIVMYPVTGTLVQSSAGVRCVGEHINVLVFGQLGGQAILCTNDSEFASRNGEVIDFSADERENIYVQTLRLCTDKFSTSANSFSMECALQGCTVMATAKDANRVSYTMRTPSGEILTESESVPLQLYTQCQSIRSFQYSVVTDTCEKDVIVRKGQVEVFREIAHYINKALVFTKVGEGSVMQQYCVTATGCCEVRTLRNGATRIVKVPFTKMKIDPECAVSALDCSLDVMLKASNLCEALRGGEICAQN